LSGGCIHRATGRGRTAVNRRRSIGLTRGTSPNAAHKGRRHERQLPGGHRRNPPRGVGQKGVAARHLAGAAGGERDGENRLVDDRGGLHPHRRRTPGRFGLGGHAHPGGTDGRITRYNTGSDT